MASDRSNAISWLSGGGGLCLAVMLALWSPGVQVAWAEGASATLPASRPLAPGSLAGFSSEGGSCQVGAEQVPDLAAQISQVLEALESQAAGGDEDVVVFNGAGHNYSSGDGVLAEILRIRAEAGREQVVRER